MDRHIAMLSLLTPGHLYPTLAVCAELVNRGYRVTYPTSERFAEQIRKTGAEPLVFNVPELKDAERSHPAPDHPHFWEILISIFWPRYLASAAATILRVEEVYARNAPDLIFYDLFSFAGRILAHRFGCPAVQHWATFAHRGTLIRENGVCRNPEPAIAFAQLLNAFMSAHGVNDNKGLWHLEELGIYFLPKQFQFDADSFDDRFCFVGPCLNRPPRAAWKNESGGRPIVLITESSASRHSEFFRTCVAAFEDSPYHVVFSVGENSPQKSLDTLPANFQFNQDTYNADILPHVALHVCQAGTGTVLESLYHGVPVLGIPISPYHAEVADRVVELGVGLQLAARDMTAAVIRDAVDRMFEDRSLAARVEHIRECFRNCGGAKLAVDRIEAFLRKKHSRGARAR